MLCTVLHGRRDVDLVSVCFTVHLRSGKYILMSIYVAESINQ